MDIKQKLNEVKEWLQKEYAGIRTGKSSPALLDSVRVESYGSLMPVNQVANISTEDARTLKVSPWDSSMISAIERAIQDADLGVSLATDSSGVRVIFPDLTIERRAQLQKLAKSKLEDARIRVRAVRDDVMKSIDKSEKDGDISEDQKFTQKDAAQKVVDETNRSLESLFDQKEVELQK